MSWLDAPTRPTRPRRRAAGRATHTHVRFGDRARRWPRWHVRRQRERRQRRVDDLSRIQRCCLSRPRTVTRLRLGDERPVTGRSTRNRQHQARLEPRRLPAAAEVNALAGPAIVVPIDLGSNVVGVAVDVAHELQQVRVILHDGGAKPPTEERPIPTMPTVERAGVAARVVPHCFGEVPSWRVEHRW